MLWARSPRHSASVSVPPSQVKEIVVCTPFIQVSPGLDAGFSTSLHCSFVPAYDTLCSEGSENAERVSSFSRLAGRESCCRPRSLRRAYLPIVFSPSGREREVISRSSQKANSSSAVTAYCLSPYSTDAGTVTLPESPPWKLHTAAELPVSLYQMPSAFVYRAEGFSG